MGVSSDYARYRRVVGQQPPPGDVRHVRGVVHRGNYKPMLFESQSEESRSTPYIENRCSGLKRQSLDPLQLRQATALYPSLPE